jgi:predicted Zn-dependent protease
MGTKPVTRARSRPIEDAPERPVSDRRRLPVSRAVIVAVVLALAVVVGYLAVGQTASWRVARQVRAAVAALRFDEAEAPLRRWLAASPHSGEAHYYLARLKLAADQPQEVLNAIVRARELGFDRAPLDCLFAVIQSRAARYAEAEPVLLEAYQESREPRIEVAQELARVYLSTYQIDRAAAPLERWRELAPGDARPYLWRNEIATRNHAEPEVLIQNYLEALKRDPMLDKARLGLAERLRKVHRVDEARREYATYLARHPKDVEALAGAGLAALEADDVPAAVHSFEAALAVEPKDTTVLKELAQINLRRGRFHEACDQLRRVAQIDRFDPDIHYTYARALKLSGDDRGAKAETELSLRLRNEHNDLEAIRTKLMKNPNDVEIRFQIARWFLDHGRDGEGLDWTKEILRQTPQHAPTQRLLAAYYDRNGNAGLANYHRTMAEAALAQESQREGAAPR